MSCPYIWKCSYRQGWGVRISQMRLTQNREYGGVASSEKQEKNAGIVSKLSQISCSLEQKSGKTRDGMANNLSVHTLMAMKARTNHSLTLITTSISWSTQGDWTKVQK